MAWQVPLQILGTAFNMATNVGDFMGIFSKPKDVTNYKKAYEYNKKLAKYQNKSQMNSALKLMKQENAYNTKFMSASSKATEALNQHLMDYQYNLERQSRQNAYGDTRIDLENAGYNPLLAVGQQSGYTSVGSGVSTQSEGMENSQMANSATDIVNKFNEMRNANKMVGQGQQRLDIDKLSSLYNNDLTSAKAEHERSMTRGQDISNNVDLITKLDQALETLNLTREERANLIQTRENLIQTNKNLVAEENEIKSRAQLNSAKSTEAYASAQNYKASAENQKEQARYNKERARGYSEGATYSGSITPFQGDVKIFGKKLKIKTPGASGSYSYHRTY